MMKFYKLDWDESHLLDMDKDVYYMDEDNRGKVYKALTSLEETIEVPDLYFTANFNVIPDEQHFPIANIPYLPFMHKKMYELMLSLGKFHHQTIPVTFIDDTCPPPYFTDNGVLSKGINTNLDYLAVRILKPFSDINYDKTEIEEYEMYGEQYVKYPGDIILNVPIDGFPPIFKIKNLANSYFVPDTTKAALEAANISGCSFTEAKVKVA